MKTEYRHYKNITREILDTVKVGDLIKVNNWDTPMIVKAVSENYFVMTSEVSGETYYSVCSKLPWDGVRYNDMVGGMFHCGSDNWIFGSPLSINHENLYEFNDEELNNLYLQQFERNECELSVRTSVPIYDLYIKEKV